jgi:hypothetical protein
VSDSLSPPLDKLSIYSEELDSCIMDIKSMRVGFDGEVNGRINNDQ